MAVGHRAVFIWIQLMLVLVFLVIYLDGGLSREPVIFFVFLWLGDVLCLATVALQMLRIRRLKSNPTAAVSSTDLNFRPGNMALFTVVVMLKLIAEILLCLKLRGIYVPLIYILIPTVVFFGIVILDLSRRLIIIHNRPHGA